MLGKFLSQEHYRLDRKPDGIRLFHLYCSDFSTTGVNDAIRLDLFQWISFGQLDISFGLWIDPLTMIMLMVVTGVGFLIHLYSIGYMHDDEGFTRFFSYLNLFIFFMLLLVMGSNYLIMFIGWEGVGLCSYLLIGFWFKNDAY
jgi:NADH-quinone oxidoreductase subunit L